MTAMMSMTSAVEHTYHFLISPRDDGDDVDDDEDDVDDDDDDIGGRTKTDSTSLLSDD